MSANQLLLRMPTTMVHVIDDDSPLAAWRTGRAAVATDSDSEIVIVVSFILTLAEGCSRKGYQWSGLARQSCPQTTLLAAGHPVSVKLCLCFECCFVVHSTPPALIHALLNTAVGQAQWRPS